MSAAQDKCALVMAGGTGGHIFPGLAVAQALREAGWRVHWLGAPGGMEERLVPPQGFAFEAVEFGGVRGKKLSTMALAPLRLARAVAQSVRVLRRVRPNVLIGMGGYISVPAGLAGAATGVPLLLHEQNSVPGLANRVLARFARRVFTAFPDALPKGEWVGNPLRAVFSQQPAPEERLAARSGVLRLLVVGGSLGAQALNELVPQALALIEADKRPVVTHQSGEKQLDALRAAYEGAGVQGELVPFIDDMASALAQADLVICRAGASTISEIAAVGAAALFVPFPHAVDDHQSVNARFLSEQGAAWLMQQKDLTPQKLADFIQEKERATLVECAMKAKTMQKTGATQTIVAACEEVAA